MPTIFYLCFFPQMLREQAISYSSEVVVYKYNRLVEGKKSAAYITASLVWVASETLAWCLRNKVGWASYIQCQEVIGPGWWAQQWSRGSLQQYVQLTGQYWPTCCRQQVRQGAPTFCHQSCCPHSRSLTSGSEDSLSTVNFFTSLVIHRTNSFARLVPHWPTCLYT